MIKSFFILMLTATQLFAGRSVSLFLCISEDGSFCCVDSGPHACKCCQDGEPAACDSHGDDEWCAKASDCGHRHEGSGTGLGDGLRAIGPCDCTHVPLLVASKHPTIESRGSLTTDATRWIATVYSTLCSNTDVDAVVLARRAYVSPPPLEFDPLSIVISTIVIRC